MKKLLFILLLLPSLAFCQLADKSNPYGKLATNFDVMYGNHNFTTFRNLDVNFCNTRFATYLQTDFNLAYKNSTETKTAQITKYVPKVSTGREFLNVAYKLENHKDINGWMQTQDSSYNLVSGVEITGSKDLIINLFLSYWPIKFNLNTYKIGDIANKAFYGDEVVLSGVNATTAKISIKKGNMDMDYFKTFGINAPKNSNDVTSK